MRLSVLLVAKECLALWREGMMQGICTMGKFVGNGHLSRHGCCHRYYYHNEYAYYAMHVFSLLRNQFWCFRKCNKITAIYNCTKVNIDCSASAMLLQCLCSGSAESLQKSISVRTGCAYSAHDTFR